MLKSRIALVLIISLLILGTALYTFFNRKQSSLPTFPAMVHRDCAPWDGAAFTVEIPLEDVGTINISIWQSPDINFPKTFSFPDTSGQNGNAILIDPVGLPKQLDGEVTFQRVQEGTPIEARFRLRSEGGDPFEGRFDAEWVDQMILCG